MIYDLLLLGRGPIARWLGRQLESALHARGKTFAYAEVIDLPERFAINSPQGEKLTPVSTSITQPSILNIPTLEKVSDWTLDYWSESTQLTYFLRDLYRQHESKILRDWSEPEIDAGVAQPIHSFTRALQTLGYQWTRARRLRPLPVCERLVASDFAPSLIVDSGDKVLVLGEQANLKTQFAARKLVLSCGSRLNFQILSASPLSQTIPLLGKGLSLQPRMILGAEVPSDLSPLYSNDPKLERVGVQLRPRTPDGVEVIFEDQATGEFLRKNQKMSLRKSFADTETEKSRIGFELGSELLEMMGQPALKEPPSARYFRNTLGGCKIGQDTLDSTVNEQFELRDHPLISVVDESILPSSPGCQSPELATLTLASFFLEQWLAQV